MFENKLNGNGSSFSKKRKIEAPTVLHPVFQRAKAVAAEAVIVEEANTAVVEEKSDIHKLLEIIGSSRCSTGHHNEWVKVSQAIKNEVGDDGLHDFVTWTCQFGSANKKREASKQYSDYIHYRREKVEPRSSVKSLHYWARQTDAFAYELAFPGLCDVLIGSEVNMLQR